VTAAEIDGSKIVGQFPAPTTADAEQFGLLFQKDNPLAVCADKALTELKASGELQKIQDTWLAGVAAPYFTQ
jgi:polar amino acid transport system substrate-binding protein